jgi:transposase
VAGDLHGSGREWRAAGHGDDRLLVGQGASFGLGCAKRGERFQAIGRSRGGRTTKIHLLVDEHGRPHVLYLTAGQASDIVAAAELIVQSRPSARLLADRAYDGDALRHSLARRGTLAVIPNKINRVNRFPFDAEAYKLRNAIERAFCRLKDFRAIATRYDKLARNFLSGICIAAVLSFWIK